MNLILILVNVIIVTNVRTETINFYRKNIYKMLDLGSMKISKIQHKKQNPVLVAGFSYEKIPIDFTFFLW